MPRVLVLGFDPRAFASQFDPAPVLAALDAGQARFAALGIDAELCLVQPDDTALGQMRDRLEAGGWDCVVIGGGIRKPPELLVMFEQVVNLVHELAPDAKIAFNTNPVDSADGVRRVLAT